MNDQEMIEFEQWLPQGVQMLSDKLPEEFVNVVSQAKSVEEIDNILNNLSQSEEGAQLINALYQAYKQISSQQNVVGSMKAGGKLDYFVNCFGRGGKTDKCGCGCKAIKAKGGEVFPAPKTTYSDKKTGEELSLEEAYSRPEDVHLVETTPDVLSRLNDISNKANMLCNLRELPTKGVIRSESIIGANPEGSGKISLPVKQRGGEINEPIPPMTYEETGDVVKTSDLGGGHSFGLILGKTAKVDKKPVMIPNKTTSASMLFTNAGRGPVLLADYGYADEGQTVFTPNEIEARKKTRLVDKANVQHPVGLKRNR